MFDRTEGQMLAVPLLLPVLVLPPLVLLRVLTMVLVVSPVLVLILVLVLVPALALVPELILVLALVLVLVLALALCFIVLLASARQRRYLITCRRAQDRATARTTDRATTARQPRDTGNVDRAHRYYEDFQSISSFASMPAYPNAAAATSALPVPVFQGRQVIR
jgi:hypothetical protein